jgi:hypothetical protein
MSDHTDDQVVWVYYTLWIWSPAVLGRPVSDGMVSINSFLHLEVAYYLKGNLVSLNSKW